MEADARQGALSVLLLAAMRAFSLWRSGSTADKDGGGARLYRIRYILEPEGRSGFLYAQTPLGSSIPSGFPFIPDEIVAK